MGSGADVRVRVRSGVVTVQVEQPVVLVLVVVTAHVQHHARSVVVAIIAKNRRNLRLQVRKPLFIMCMLRNEN